MRAFLAKFHHRRSSSRHRVFTLPTAAAGDDGSNVRHDIFERLPFELHVLVVAHLEPRDINAALDASRLLQLVWLSDEIWPALADRWFPGLTDHIRLTSADGLARSELFRQHLRRISRRAEGKFATAMHHGFGLASTEFFHLKKSVPINEGGIHSYESVEDLEIDHVQQFSRFMMYSNGRMAWWPEGYSMPYLAVVDDLRTRARRVYMFPSREDSARGYKTAMGKQLFIMGHGNKLHVWHLELDRLESFEVPETFKRCITEGETVLVVTISSDVYMWKFGGQLQRIDTEKLSCYPRELVATSGPPVWTPRIWLSSQRGLYLRNSQLFIDFILSPTVSGVFFIITLAFNESGILMVHEIQDGEVAATYVMEDCIYSDPSASERGMLKWERLNSFGGYCLVQIIQEPSVTNNSRGNGLCPCGRQSRQLVSLCFNIYTKTFTTLRHHLGELSPWISHIWDDRLLIMDDQFHKGQTVPHRRPVMSLAPCIEPDTPQGRAVSVPMYTTIHEGPLTYRRRRVPFDVRGIDESLKMELGFDVLREFSPDPRWTGPFIPNPSEANPGKLTGDADFFIFVSQPSYTLLSFGVDFPTQAAAAEESRFWRRKPKAKDTLGFK